MNKVLYYIIYIIWYALSLLHLRILYVISDFIYLIIYRLLGYRIKVVRNNLKTSFPEKTEAELRNIERKFYHNLCDYFVETLKMATMSEKQMRRRMTYKGVDIVNECFADGQSVALFLGHIFNWEWITSIPLWIHSPEVECGQLYHALENPIFDKLFLNTRERWNSKCIALTDILRVTVENNRNHRVSVIGYIGDQVPHWNNIHHWCQFLNHDTPVMTGTERIAVKNNQALVYVDIRRIRRGYYEAEFQLMTRKPKDLKEFEGTDIFFRKLEETIRRQPEQWLWSHNRWKRTREEFDERFKVVGGKVVPK